MSCGLLCGIAAWHGYYANQHSKRLSVCSVVGAKLWTLQDPL